MPANDDGFESLAVQRCLEKEIALVGRHRQDEFAGNRLAPVALCARGRSARCTGAVDAVLADAELHARQLEPVDVRRVLDRPFQPR
jgi:hypothetical protein